MVTADPFRMLIKLLKTPRKLNFDSNKYIAQYKAMALFLPYVNYIDNLKRVIVSTAPARDRYFLMSYESVLKRVPLSNELSQPRFVCSVALDTGCSWQKIRKEGCKAEIRIEDELK